MRQDRKEKLFFYKEGGGGYDEEKNKHTAPVTHKLENTQIYKYINQQSSYSVCVSVCVGMPVSLS